MFRLGDFRAAPWWVFLTHWQLTTLLGMGQAKSR